MVSLVEMQRSAAAECVFSLLNGYIYIYTSRDTHATTGSLQLCYIEVYNSCMHALTIVLTYIHVQ